MQELLSGLFNGLLTGFQPMSLLLIVFGLIVGILIGAAPGIGGAAGLALMLPFALTMPPSHAIILFVSTLVGSGYGGSIPAVVLKIPGQPSTMLTTIEGYPFHLRGQGGKALLVCLWSSVIGQVFSIFVFVLFVVPLSQVAVKLLFPEMFAIILLGLLACAGLMGSSLIKGVVAIAIGALLALVGFDPVSGVPRMTFGVPELGGGLESVPVIVGLLAVRELVNMAAEVKQAPLQPAGGRKLLRPGWLSAAERKEIRGATALGAVIGTFVGLIPGAGGTVASFLSYDTAKRFSKDRAEFGKGTKLKGLAAIDSANNSVIGGELVPTLGLGIPGAPAMVVLMAVLAAQGLFPGPELLRTAPELLYATFGGLMVATLLLAIIGYLSIGPSVYISNLSRPGLLVGTAVLVIVGVYSLRWSLFDVWTALIIGIFGFFAEKYGFPIAPMALAFVLGPMLESNLRRGLVLTFGWEGFVTRPVTLVLLLLCAAILLSPLVRMISKRRRIGSPSRA